MTDLLPQNIHDALAAKAIEHLHPREMIIEVLRAIQDHRGWVPDEGVELAGQILGLTPLQIEEIATFYDKIYRQPVGKRVIHVCDSIACWSRGAENLYLYLQETLGISPGETTQDGTFTLLPTCCLGLCGEAPAMMIGLKAYGRLTRERIDEILATERAEAGA